jgi:hypothetical protein
MELPSHISFHPILLSTKKRRDIDRYRKARIYREG